MRTALNVLTIDFKYLKTYFVFRRHGFCRLELVRNDLKTGCTAESR
jgi:hypothetical protein